MLFRADVRVSRGCPARRESHSRLQSRGGLVSPTRTRETAYIIIR